MYKRIKELRQDNDIKQNYIAELLGIKQNSYSQIENGKAYPNSEYLIKLAKLYSVSIDYILELTDIQKPYPRSKRLTFFTSFRSQLVNRELTPS